LTSFLLKLILNDIIFELRSSNLVYAITNNSIANDYCFIFLPALVLQIEVVTSVRSKGHNNGRCFIAVASAWQVTCQRELVDSPS